jgi:hypothetical protein
VGHQESLPHGAFVLLLSRSALLETNFSNASLVTSVLSIQKFIYVDPMDGSGICHGVMSTGGIPRGSGLPMENSPPGIHAMPQGFHRAPPSDWEW